MISEKEHEQLEKEYREKMAAKKKDFSSHSPYAFMHPNKSLSELS